MHFNSTLTRRITHSLLLLVAAPVLAQAVTPPPAPQPDAAPTRNARVTQASEQRTERLRVEDSAVVIDEVRIGGETRTIDVHPKGGMPAYQVSPQNGERSWKVLGF